MKGQLNYLVWQSWNRIYLNFILLAEPFTDEGGEETAVPKKTPDDELQKMAHTKARKFQPQQRLEPANPHCSIGDRLGKQTC